MGEVGGWDVDTESGSDIGIKEHPFNLETSCSQCPRPVEGDTGETWPLQLKNFRVVREEKDQKKRQRIVVPECDKYCRISESCRSIMGAGPSRRNKRWLDCQEL